MAKEEFIERRYFLAALQAKEREYGRGFQKQLAGDTGYSDSYMNQIIKGNRGLSFKAQSRIAKALKYKYTDFLELGKNILDGTPGPADSKPAEPSTPDGPLLQSLLLNIQQLTDAVKASNERIDAQGAHIVNIGKALDRLNDSVQEYAQTGDRSALKKLRDAG
jgi:transcriptional regulator with XRE-family HTH domain